MNDERSPPSGNRVATIKDVAREAGVSMMTVSRVVNGKTNVRPSAESGALPVEGGVALAYRREIESADDPDARRAELEAELTSAQSVFPRAEEFGVHDLIDPRTTRPRLCEWIDEIQAQLRTSRGPRRYSPRP